LPQPPLCDLLPLSYLSSLKRTEARVRFAENHAGPSGSTSILGLSEAGPTSPTLEASRPGLRRRSPGPPTKEEREAAGEADDEWEIQSLRTKAEEAVAKLAEAVSLGGASDPTGLDAELRQQLSQLNVPRDISSGEEDGAPGQGMKGVAGEALSPGKNSTPSKGKSNLYSPYPANLPLALLKLMEVYVCGLAEVPAERGGWSEAKRERALGFVKSLSGSLGEAERLCASE
jgi:putative membrane protein